MILVSVTSSSLSEVVLFELTRLRLAQHLCAHLGAARLAWVDSDDEAFVVGAVLNSDPDDFAELFRSVESWVGNQGVAAVPYEVDGRMYVLHRVEVRPVEAA